MRNTRLRQTLIIASAVAIMSLAGGGLVLAGFSNESVLYSFTGGSDGANPQGGLVFDAKGNLYGTTNGGGADGNGTVFELTHMLKFKDGRSTEVWSEDVLYTFTGGSDGANPQGGLIFDAKGNLYDTTWGGGAYSGGLITATARRSS